MVDHRDGHQRRAGFKGYLWSKIGLAITSSSLDRHLCPVLNVANGRSTSIRGSISASAVRGWSSGMSKQSRDRNNGMISNGIISFSSGREISPLLYHRTATLLSNSNSKRLSTWTAHCKSTMPWCYLAIVGTNKPLASGAAVKADSQVGCASECRAQCREFRRCHPTCWKPSAKIARSLRRAPDYARRGRRA